MKVPPEDSDALRFLWWEANDLESPSEFQMKSHIFGAKDSPNCANFCLKRAAEDSSRIFIAMLHLYGARGDTKIWAKIISAHAKKCSRMKVSVAEGRWV